MRSRRTLQELTIKDNFMFAAVMCDEKHCQRFLEMSLGFQIERIELSKEKSIIYHPEYKGIRLDVYAKDENNTHYNVEMQSVRKDELFRRARYYHSQIDMELLVTGAAYTELPNTYVIFICDFDPFSEGKYCYTIQSCCKELNGRIVHDGNYTIFLNTKGKNKKEVPEMLVKFLDFVGADLKESMKEYDDEFVKALQKSVAHVKKSREMEERFMLLELVLHEERMAARAEGHAEGHAEGRLEGRLEGKAEEIVGFLEELSVVPEDLREKIMKEKDLIVLKRWLKLAARAESIEQFLKEM